MFQVMWKFRQTISNYVMVPELFILKHMPKEPAALIPVEAAPAGVIVQLLTGDIPYFRIAGRWMDEHKSADGSIRNHCIALGELYSQGLTARNQLHNILFNRVVRTARISCRRLDYFVAFKPRCG